MKSRDLKNIIKSKRQINNYKNKRSMNKKSERSTKKSKIRKKSTNKILKQIIHTDSRLVRVSLKDKTNTKQNKTKKLSMKEERNMQNS